jgi:hypothetical protein
MISRLSAVFLALIAAFALGACSSNKPSASFHEGDSPTIHYHEREVPGGRVGNQTYR